jgi:hypothetical protein
MDQASELGKVGSGAGMETVSTPESARALSTGTAQSAPAWFPKRDTSMQSCLHFVLGIVPGKHIECTERYALYQLYGFAKKPWTQCSVTALSKSFFPRGDTTLS